MTRDEIKAVFARRQAAFDRHDAVALANCYTADGVVDSPLAGGTAKGRDEIERIYQAYFHAFPDITQRHEDLLIDGDRAALFARTSGTDRGGFMGMPATGRSISVSVAILYDFRDGLIARERRVYDFTGMLVQIGTLKAKTT